MSSCLYECRVIHERLEPVPHRFVYNVFSFCLDIDEIDAVVAKTPWISRNRWNLFSFFDRDHIDVRALLRERGIVPSRVILITNLRILGYVFNPVSFYFCFDDAGAPLAAVAEVNNTFGETKPYFLERDSLSNGRFDSTQTKHFYISPFVAHDSDMRMRLAIPGERAGFVIDDFEKGRHVLHTSMIGKRVELTSARLFVFALKYPLLTLRVIAGIHWQALRLWFKRVPFYRKAGVS
ncbi:MAG: DUF1365 domain-containing protein [Thermoanaerobaculia bacterium]